MDVRADENEGFVQELAVREVAGELGDREAPLSSTVAGLIVVTSKPDVPSTETLTRSRCEVSMTRCSCGLISIGGEAGGHVLGEVAALMRTGCYGMNALLTVKSSVDPANPPT